MSNKSVKAAVKDLDFQCYFSFYKQLYQPSPSGNSFAKRLAVPSAFVAEALALKAALSAAVTRGIDSLRVFSDSKSLIDLLATKKNHIWIQGIPLIFTIYHSLLDLSLFSFFRVWKILWQIL
ncbi:hypothetical protein YC2023_105413 [Brassica napus]